MKKRWKIFAIVCASIAALGVALCVTGFAMGATWENMSIQLGPFSGWNYNATKEVDMEEGGIEEDGNRSTGEMDTSEVFEGVHSMDVEMHWGTVYVKRHDEAVVKVESSNLDLGLECYEEDGELTVETTKKRWKGSHHGSIYIYLPRDMKLSDASFSVGAGRLSVDDIEAEELDLDSGAGEIEVAQFKAGDVNVDVGMGEAIITGSYSGNADVSCGVGSVEMTLGGQEKDYSYTVSSGPGDIAIGGSVYSGLANDKTVHNSGNKQIDISCGIGDVNIGFSGK